MALDPATLRALADAGLVVLLLLVLIGGHLEWWVYGRQHRAIVRSLTGERDYWRRTALRALGVAKVAVDPHQQDEASDE